ncbi:MAG TPA: molecular chaperone TorD family protein [Candidatus Margulisiibacteriota bacterium]|nr:molecular chaperone TorD family protein [Candidatus Margulisiibacteriota bacterium]
MELANLQTASERAAAERSRVYQLLKLAFAFPDEDLYDAVRDGSLATALGEACAALPYDVTGIVTSDLDVAPDAYADFESEYIRLFDVGAAGPPCPLYDGVYVGDRMKVMEDATRFYNFFGLRVSPQMRELPDHITAELEFLHYLTFREAEARQAGLDPSSLLRAERDFLARHLCKWVPRLQAKLVKQTTVPFYPALVRFAAAFFERDRAYAAAAAGA